MVYKSGPAGCLFCLGAGFDGDSSKAGGSENHCSHMMFPCENIMYRACMWATKDQNQRARAHRGGAVHNPRWFDRGGRAGAVVLVLSVASRPTTPSFFCALLPWQARCPHPPVGNRLAPMLMIPGTPAPLLCHPPPRLRSAANKRERPFGAQMLQTTFESKDVSN